MADLIQIKTDGTETGATAAVKINNGFDKTDSNRDQLDGLIAEDIPSRVTVLEDNMVTIPQADLQNLLNIQELSDEPTGFDLRDNTTHGVMELCGVASSNSYHRIDENNNYSFITGTNTFGDGATSLADKTFIHYPSASSTTVPKSFSFWNDGNKFVKETTQVIELLNVSTKQIIVYDNAGIIGYAADINDAITHKTICSVITGNPALTKKIVFANERHGLSMNGATHEYLHNAHGTQYGSGLDIIGVVDNGTTFTTIKEGFIYDEDLEHRNVETTTAPFIWRDSNGVWTISEDADNKLAYNDGATVVYNEKIAEDNWALTDISTGFMAMHFFATNDAEFPLFKVIGQEVYTSRTDARNRLSGAVSLLQAGDLPAPEFLHCYSMIIHNNATGQIEVGADGEIYVDYRYGYPVGRY